MFQLEPSQCHQLNVLSINWKRDTHIIQCNFQLNNLCQKTLRTSQVIATQELPLALYLDTGILKHKNWYVFLELHSTQCHYRSPDLISIFVKKSELFSSSKISVTEILVRQYINIEPLFSPKLTDACAPVQNVLIFGEQTGLQYDPSLTKSDTIQSKKGIFGGLSNQQERGLSSSLL